MTDQPTDTSTADETAPDDAEETTGRYDFNVIIDGRREYLDIVTDINLLSGVEVMLIERESGLRVRDWFVRIGNLATWTGTDMLLVAFIGANQKQVAEYGSSELSWDEFARVCRPLSMLKGRPPAAAEDDNRPPTNRAQRRTAAKK